jgi:hypothetical protein
MKMRGARFGWGMLLLLSVLGLPRIPFTDIPICAALIPFAMGRVANALVSRRLTLSLVACLVFLLWGLAVWCLQAKSGSVDLGFLLSFVVKMLISLAAAAVCAPVIAAEPFLLLGWLVIQVLCVAASIFSDAAYSFFLLFAGAANYEVFSYLYGVRGIGFGLLHVNGIIALISAGTLWMFLAQEGRLKRWLIGMVILLEALCLPVSRTGMIVLSVQLFLYSRIALLIVLIAGAAATWVVIDMVDQDGILLHTLELGINVATTGEVRTTSTDASSQMIIFPTEVGEAILGHGLFFENGLFFKETDVGFSRIAFFGGYPFLFFFVVASLMPLYSTLRISRAYLLPVMYFTVTFFLVNFKGLSDVGIYPFILLIIAAQSSPIRAFGGLRDLMIKAHSCQVR